MKVSISGRARRILFTAAAAGILAAGAGCDSGGNPGNNGGGDDGGAENTLIDTRDGQRYRTVEISNLTWMAENLNYVTDSSWCYDDNGSNCAVYGRLYSWDAAMSACPAGWRLPSVHDWNYLTKTAGGWTSGNSLKSQTGWTDYQESSGNGTDDYGFSALPGGIRLEDGTFLNADSAGYWWTSFDYMTDEAFIRWMYIANTNVSESISEREDALSVRCVRGDLGNPYTVAFNTNGGVPEAISNVILDNVSALGSRFPANPTKAGSTFAGWFEGEEQYTTYTIIIKNITLTAKWNVLGEREDGSELSDPRDGQSYRTVIIGGKRWMAENLNYTTDSSWCYADNESNCSDYGRLYTLEDALTACPAGWRLPEGDDWMEMAKTAGGYDVGGAVLKSETGWGLAYGSNGTDDFGFSALPGGSRDTQGRYSFIGRGGYWWSTMPGGPWAMGSYSAEVRPMLISSGRDYNMYSVRCVEE